MKTLIFRINSDNPDLIKSLQKDWSQDFRKLYNNIDLIEDKDFLNTLKIKSSKLKEYLIKEVFAFKEKYESGKSRILENINILESKPLTPKTFKKISSLRRSLNSKICFGGRKNLQNRTKNLISKEMWKSLRLYPIIFYGETSRKGNRFFDFKDLSSGQILFKLESTKIKIPLRISTKKHSKELELLETLSKSKLIPITIKLTSTTISLSFDESILYGTNFDSRKFQHDKPSKLSKEDTKNYWKLKHQEHENDLKSGKLERFLAIDMNPNEIGYVITDKNLKVLDKGSYTIEGKISENKRKFEYSQIIKDLFKLIKHFKVSYFVIEDLDIQKNNFGNRVSNRKNKLEFKKNYVFGLIEKRCNETGTILRKINPAYSSFIGNLTYKEYDPIASSMEIARRGIGQFTKGFKLIPDFNLDNLITEKIDGYVDLNLIKSWKELYGSIRNKSYRRKEKIFSSQKFTRGAESHVCLCF